MNTLNVIIPAYNEEKNIVDSIQSVQEVLSKMDMKYQIIVVNDRSTDDTKILVEKLTKDFPHLTLINRKGNHGLGRCINRGLEELKEGYLVIVMADLADNVQDIPKMVQKLDQGFDMVCGSRYVEGGEARHHLKLKGLLSRFLGQALRICSNLPTSDATNAFKMYRTSLLDQIGILRSDNYASGLEVLVKANGLGFKITEIPTIWRDRNLGSSHFRIFRTAPEYIFWFFWSVWKTLAYKAKMINSPSS